MGELSAHARHESEALAGLLSNVSLCSKETAEKLTREFGSVGAVLAAAGTSRLLDVAQDPPAVRLICDAQRALDHMLALPETFPPILSDWKALEQFLHMRMAFLKTEHVRVIFLGTRNQLLADDVVSRGTVDAVSLYVREVLVRALELGSSAIIIAHNHPSGDPRPSRADIDITRALIAAGKTVGVCVHDHIVVGRNGQVSMRSKGLI